MNHKLLKITNLQKNGCMSVKKERSSKCAYVNEIFILLALFNEYAIFNLNNLHLQHSLDGVNRLLCIHIMKIA